MKDKLQKLRDDYENAVIGYQREFMNQFGIEYHDSWWVGDRIGIDNFCFGDMYAISLDDMIYCVEHGVTYDEFVAHTDYWLKCADYGLPKINLKSWHEGAPRVPQEVFDRLDSMKQEMEKLIDEYKEDNGEKDVPRLGEG